MINAPVAKNQSTQVMKYSERNYPAQAKPFNFMQLTSVFYGNPSIPQIPQIPPIPPPQQPPEQPHERPPEPKKTKRFSAVIIVALLLVCLVAGGTTQATILGQNMVIGGDIIVGINGTPITNTDSLLSYLERNTLPGQTVNFTVVRSGETQTVSVTIGKLS